MSCLIVHQIADNGHTNKTALSQYFLRKIISMNNNSTQNIDSDQQALLIRDAHKAKALSINKEADIELASCENITSEMSTNKGAISKDDLFDVIKYGCKWHAKKIKKELDIFIEIQSHIFNHDFRNGFENNCYYIYDNDCYLYVYDEKIVLRSDRENVYSANKTSTRQIKEVIDIQDMYEYFCSMTVEDDEE